MCRSNLLSTNHSAEAVVCGTWSAARWGRKRVEICNFLFECRIDSTVESFQHWQNASLCICATRALLAELRGHAERYSDVSLKDNSYPLKSPNHTAFNTMNNPSQFDYRSKSSL